MSGHADLLDIVLNYPISIHTADTYGSYPIHYAAQLCTGEQMRKGLEMLKKLIECNAEVNCLDKQKRTPFMWAASAGDRLHCCVRHQPILFRCKRCITCSLQSRC